MPGMTDRDYFAAAALTGLLASDNYTRTTTSAEHAAVAYELADAMLRERAKTNHDAAPAARAAPESVGTDKAEPLQGLGTGDTQEPVAWGVASHFRVLATSISRMDAVDMQSDYAYHTEIVPLYRSPPVTEPMPKEKRAEVCAGPLAWAAIRENGQPLWLSYDRSGAEGMVNGMAEVVPLYRHPPCQDFSQKNLTLTDAERDDICVWLAECLRQASTATEGCNEELAERWTGRAKRAAAMIERLGGEG